jgi:apolipoprotein N-acyltransferase
MLKNYQKYFILILSGLLLNLAFAPFNFYLVAYIFFIPVLFSIEKSSPKENFLGGLLFGFIFISTFQLWLFSLSAWAPWPFIFLIWLLYSLYFAFFYGLTFYLSASLLQNKWFASTKALKFLILPLIWILLEYLRKLGPIGHPGGIIGYSQTSNLPILQLASIFGVLGISFFVILINFLIYKLLSTPPKKTRLLLSLTLCILIVIPYLPLISPRFSPLSRGYARRAEGLKELKIAIIQGNHTQKAKMTSQAWPKIRADYLRLTKTAAQNKARLIFWPETFIPALNLNNKPFLAKLQSLAQKYNSSIIFGTPLYKKGKYYNAAVVMNPQGLSPQIYKKEKLMPFGEYTPFKKLFSFFPLTPFLPTVDFTSHKNSILLQAQGLNLGLGICLESLYPKYFRKNTKKGADILVTLVNNAWFFDSSAADKHLQISILRAVENSSPLLQVANTGISAIISPQGRILAKAKLNKRIILVH